MATAERTLAALPELKGARILIVEGRFYDMINDELLAGACAVVESAGGVTDVITVPGALEIPIAIEMAIKTGRYSGAIALGCVIRGETYHFEVVAGESSRALMDLGIRHALPLGNGILTVENEAQALARAKRSDMNKGGDAARACLALIKLRMELAPREVTR
jgi:6,7-dimethyl-8-ribityllumazine synthase